MDGVRSWQTAFLCLGSNVGDRELLLARALSELAIEEGVRIVECSRILENPPLLFEEQGDFMNQVVRIQTTHTPAALLERLKALEQKVGRTQTFRNGPREIDLDILAFRGSYLQTPNLVLPHPGLPTRPFLRTLLSQLGTTPEDLEQGRFT